LPGGPLARYRSPALADAAKGFVEQFSAPGDVVLDLFCQGPSLLRQIVSMGRRAVGASVNPLNLLVAGIDLNPLRDFAALNAAFTRLADSPKGDRPLHRHLTDLYRSACLECGDEGIAIWFAWDAEGGYPYAKAVHCPRCGESQGLTDDADIEVAQEFEHRGLAYHYALNRAAPAGHPARHRTAELIELYTPRNLSALVDVTMRLEGLDVARQVRAALQGILVRVFDQACSLDGPDEARERPRTLRRPPRFIERNVWFLLEAAMARQQTLVQPEPSSPERRADLDGLLATAEPGYTLLASPARQVAERLPSGSVSLILVDPPRPDGVFWALCALWACWLWDAPVAHAMRPYLGRRRFDWAWHREVMGTALTAVAHLVPPAGRLITLFDTRESALAESVCSAAAGAGYDLLGWGWEPSIGYQLVWSASGARAPREVPSNQAANIARDCLIERAEPTPRAMVHAAVCTHLAQLREAKWPSYQESEQVLARCAFELVPGDDDLCWLPDPAGTANFPLADRVERWVERAFHSQPVWQEGPLLRHVYRRFDGRLTPDLPLVYACVDSYGVRTPRGWRLREEDLPPRRSKELQTLQEDLIALGRRLGFRVRQGDRWDVHWQEGGQDIYLFLLSATAALGWALLSSTSIPAGASPCLVFPGGRAELLAHKLQRDRRMARIAGEGGWQWIKFRHLRHLIAEELDRHSFERVLGLDPVTGREGVQIPLIFGGNE
jgi:hypothetical protein